MRLLLAIGGGCLVVSVSDARLAPIGPQRMLERSTVVVVGQVMDVREEPFGLGEPDVGAQMATVQVVSRLKGEVADVIPVWFSGATLETLPLEPKARAVTGGLYLAFLEPDGEWERYKPCCHGTEIWALGDHEPTEVVKIITHVRNWSRLDSTNRQRIVGEALQGPPTVQRIALGLIRHEPDLNQIAAAREDWDRALCGIVERGPANLRRDALVVLGGALFIRRGGLECLVRMLDDHDLREHVLPAFERVRDMESSARTPLGIEDRVDTITTWWSNRLTEDPGRGPEDDGPK